jgi:hypothetical protein
MPVLAPCTQLLLRVCVACLQGHPALHGGGGQPLRGLEQDGCCRHGDQKSAPKSGRGQQLPL